MEGSTGAGPGRQTKKERGESNVHSFVSLNQLHTPYGVLPMIEYETNHFILSSYNEEGGIVKVGELEGTEAPLGGGEKVQ